MRWRRYEKHPNSSTLPHRTGGVPSGDGSNNGDMTMEKELVYFLLAALIVTLLTFGGVLWMSAAACSGKAASFDAYDWGPVKGCMVLHNGKWLPLENIRGFDDKG